MPDETDTDLESKITVDREEWLRLCRLQTRVRLYLDARSHEQASVVGYCLTKMREAAYAGQ